MFFFISLGTQNLTPEKAASGSEDFSMPGALVLVAFRALSVALVCAVVCAARGGEATHPVSFNAHFVLRGRVVAPPPFSPAAILITLTSSTGRPEVLTDGNGTFAVAVLRKVLATRPATLTVGCSTNAVRRCYVHGRARVERVAQNRTSAIIDVPPIALYQYATTVDKVSGSTEGVAQPHWCAHDELAQNTDPRAAATIAALLVLLLAAYRSPTHTADAAGAEGSASAPLSLIDTESATDEVPASTMVLVYA